LIYKLTINNLILTNIILKSNTLICSSLKKHQNMDPITIGLGAAGLVSSLFGGYMAGKERKKMRSELDALEAENKAIYNAQALGDYTQRADAQNILRQMRNQLDRQTKRAANTQAITGGTIEQTAAMKDSANRALADTMANLGAVGAQFKDRVTDRYLNRKNQLSTQRMNLLDQSARGWEGLMQTGLNTSAGALSSLIPVASANIPGAAPGNIAGVGTAVNTSPIKNVDGIISNKYNAPWNAKK
jgi:hypothetical protein